MFRAILAGVQVVSCLILFILTPVPMASAEVDYSKSVDLDDYVLRREIPTKVVDKRGREKDAVLVHFRIKQCVYPDGVQVCGRPMSIDTTHREYEMGWWGLYGVRKPGERGRAKWLIEPKYLIWRQLDARYALVREFNKEFCRLDLKTLECEAIGGTRLIENLGEWPDWVKYVTYTFPYDVDKFGTGTEMTPHDAILISPTGEPLLRIPNATQPQWMRSSHQVMLSRGVETIIPQDNYLMVKQSFGQSGETRETKSLYRFASEVGLQKVEMDDLFGFVDDFPYSDGSEERYYGYRLFVRMSEQRDVYWPFETNDGTPIFPPENFRGFGPAFAKGRQVASYDFYSDNMLWYAEWSSTDGPRYAIFESESRYPTADELIATEQIATLTSLQKHGADLVDGHRQRVDTGQLIISDANGKWSVLRNANPSKKDEVDALDGRSYYTAAMNLSSQAEAFAQVRAYAGAREEQRLAVEHERELARKRREEWQAAQKRAAEARRAAIREAEAQLVAEQSRLEYANQLAIAASQQQARKDLIEGTFPAYRLRLYYDGPLSDASIQEKASALSNHMDFWAAPENQTTTYGLTNVPAWFVEAALPYMSGEKAAQIKEVLPYTRSMQESRQRAAARQAHAQRLWDDVHNSISNFNAGPVQGPVQTSDPIYERQSKAWAFGKANRPPCTPSDPCGPGNEFREFE